MARAGQSSERAALIHRHSDMERQKEVAGGIDVHVRAEREKAKAARNQERSGTQRARNA